MPSTFSYDSGDGVVVQVVGHQAQLTSDQGASSMTLSELLGGLGNSLASRKAAIHLIQVSDALDPAFSTFKWPTCLTEVPGGLSVKSKYASLEVDEVVALEASRGVRSSAT